VGVRTESAREGGAKRRTLGRNPRSRGESANRLFARTARNPPDRLVDLKNGGHGELALIVNKLSPPAAGLAGRFLHDGHL
jgi:hypothetical protein